MVSKFLKIVFILISVCVFGSNAFACDENGSGKIETISAEQARSLEFGVMLCTNEAVIITSRLEITDVIVGSETIVSVRPIATDRVAVTALAAGQTNLIISDQNGVTSALNISVAERPKVQDQSSIVDLSKLIEKGKVAFSVKIPLPNIIGGLLKSGNYVDVVFSNVDLSAEAVVDGNAAFKILQNVRVLAVGDDVLEFREQQSSILNESDIVVLEVLPSHVELLVAAQALGELSLTLRSEDDFGEISSINDNGNSATFFSRNLRPQIKILAYTNSLHVGSEVSLSHLSVRQVDTESLPEKYVSADALDNDQLVEHLQGAKLMKSVNPGDLFSWDDVARVEKSTVLTYNQSLNLGSEISPAQLSVSRVDTESLPAKYVSGDALDNDQLVEHLRGAKLTKSVNLGELFNWNDVARVEMLTVLTYNQSLNLGSEISPAQLSVSRVDTESLPAKYVSADALENDQLVEHLRMAKLTKSVNSGDFFSWDDVELFENIDISKFLTADKRIYTMSVNSTIDRQPFVQPGDFVDLLWVVAINDTDGFRSSIIAKDIEVLAVNDQLVGSKKAKAKSVSQLSYTMALLPNQIEAIAYAKTVGDVSLVISDNQAVTSASVMSLSEMIALLGRQSQKIEVLQNDTNHNSQATLSSDVVREDTLHESDEINNENFKVITIIRGTDQQILRCSPKCKIVD